MRRRPKPLAFVVSVLIYLPIAALLALAGYAFTWKVPFAFLLTVGFMLLRIRITRSWGAPGRARTIIELFACAFIGAFVAGLLFGGVWPLAGFAIGFSLRLGEIPITYPRSWQSNNANQAADEK